ncbi:amino acid permease [Sulfolobus sp. A20]|uniref:APC family permease n=1 Tax=Sulfolobaceae TaxID=118883 RepID=UPI000845CDC8|nr:MULTISPECIES: APC family permease [unclassified Sulfolobus]TRM78694.1 APC family permease [Sulfolobus sp. A20-N-F8]TRM84487.1 APC family permease [Sulfolobus sp. F3]TRM86757.1 APC family permease [Sulfolobus sp. C3]TRM97502.1 APC family permease [Sulfolobus sp. E1]TRN02613.1 APC family permease [Sulfolobus sp. F1]
MAKGNVKLFVRETSGLVKNVSLLDATMLNVANMGAGLAIFIGISPYIVKGAVLWVASLLTFLFTLPLVVLYTYFIQRIPRTGGDYVWLSRRLNGPLGAIMGIALAFNMPPFFALSAFFSVSAISTVLSVIGSLDSQPYLVNLANNVFTTSNAYLAYGLAALAFTIIILINIFRPKWGYTLTSALGILSLLGTLVAILVIAFNVSDFHVVIQPFLKAFNLTATPYTGPRFSWSSTIYMIPYFASFAYIWLYAGPAVASEIKSKRGVRYNLILGSVLTLVFITVPFLLMDLAGGYGFNYSLYPTYTYNFWSVSIALAKNYALQWFLGISLIAWEFFVMAFGVVVFARYVFAFSFDRLFPEVFSRLNREGSPVYAHLLDFAVTLVFLAVPIISPNGYEALYSYTPLAIAYLILVSIAGVLQSLKEKNAGMLISSILSILFMGFMGYYAFTNPYFGVITSEGQPYLPGIAYILSLIGLGAVIFLSSYVYRMKKNGIDIRLVYKEIPPE